MKEVKSIKLTSLNNEIEKEILLLLKEEGQCIYGEIIKQSNLSYNKGKETIYSLINKGYIRYAGRSTKLELAIDLI
ncbi:hypothetical protein J1N10_09000 [Carboxylicivirga sp. A043]|uniref:hypothetical protein n=1 Tax=Carboxylicivirga litoralis TaxID=2816963 RepID=UPI0021CB8268|nr:hypothetical protein [Carboxylicivirga sp. A043]MCU4156115.1 hypothetical protein [Carboxylicivirga sp. A043]